MLFTIGHSNRTWNEFVDLLKKHSITILVDVRMFPHSKVHKHFNKEYFEQHLKKEGIAYLQFPALGGRRKPDGSDTNAAWENDQFRGYADYMQTSEFRKAVKELLKLNGNVAIMCAEAVPWRCHRQLVADYLTAQGHEVYDIISDAKLHKLTKFAKVKDGKLTYPAKEKQRTL